MRHLTPLTIIGLLAVIAGSCYGDLFQPREDLSEIDPADTAQTLGALLANRELMHGNLAWVPGTDLVAFTARLPTGTCAIKTLDVASGNTAVIDDDCAGMYSFTQPYFRRLVAAPDDSALYYTVGIGPSSESEFPLRVADLTGGGTTTLRSVSWGDALAVSPDSRHLAYSAGSEGLIVRDLSSGTEIPYIDCAPQEGERGPIVFSPNGTQLLCGRWLWPNTILRRLSLDDGTCETVSLPAGARPQLFHWGASGIEVLAEMHQQYPSEYHVLNLTTGGSIQVGSLLQGEGVPYEDFVGDWEAWTSDGTRVAYWTIRCVKWAALFDCDLTRSALFVADTRSGTRVRVAYTGAGSGPTVFSPDGARLVYYVSEGDFYLVEVP